MRATDSKGRYFRLEHISCPTCGTRNLRILGKRGGQSHRYKYGIETSIVECRTCGLLFPDPFPFPENHDELYANPDTYFAGSTPDSKVESFREVVTEAKRRSRLDNPRVLDVGSGQGEFVAAAQRAGITDVVGIEFAEAMRRGAKNKLSVELLPHTIEQFAATNPERFDIITLNAVLEHVYDPNTAMASCAALLKSRGLLYIDVPNEPYLLTEIAGLFEKVRRSGVVYHLAPTWEPFHVFGFNKRAIIALLAKHDFAIEHLVIHSSINVPNNGSLKDRVKSTIAREINRAANWAGRASNLFIWARKQH